MVLHRGSWSTPIECNFLIFSPFIVSKLKKTKKQKKSCEIKRINKKNPCHHISFNKKWSVIFHKVKRQNFHVAMLDLQFFFT